MKRSNTSMPKFSLSFSLLIVSGLLATGCATETAEDQKIQAALACLDTATSSQVDSCVSQVDGLTSAKAALIRCSGDFIAQGLTGTRLAKAFEQQNPKSGQQSTNPTTTMASYLVFNPALTNHTAAIAVTNCNASGVKSVMGLAAMVQVATTVATISGGLPASLDPANLGNGFDPTAIKAAVGTLLTSVNNSDPTALQQAAAIGSAAQTAQTAYCGTGSTLSSQDVCTKLNDAIRQAQGDSENIGKILLAALNQ